ncbi:carotenoid oxygenase family protein [Prochlorococcus sp. MIT 1307]|uniref:carotenoid oxygenase family protein n=1 Tax=Prochlorococcus sp. MIT 1307 TaxID=3096219 RepID=UPI002A761CBB|nr:carotenoid oxygenase family protein [Prochlorococcus sp. MIT 1307]
MSKSALNPATTKVTRHFDRHDWASGYCNVEKELNNVRVQPLRGTIPKELCGFFYRNGPGRLERNGQRVHHPFDGDGMITSLHFKESQLKLSNRFVQTEGWQQEEEAGKFIYRGVFGTQKPGGAIANAFDLRFKNIANTHVVKLGDQLLALWEAAGPHALNPITLETYGLSNLNGVLKEGEPFSAHPRFDPGHHGTRRMVTFGVKTGPKSTVRLMEFETEGKNAGQLISSRKDSFNGFSFLHDFAITPNWAIFLQNAISFNPLPFILGQKGAAQCLSSKPGSKGKFLLIPRDCGIFAGQEPRSFDAPDGFVFHHLNAWEQNKQIVVESIHYPDFPEVGPQDDFLTMNFDQIPAGILSRCEINLASKQVITTRFSDQCCEFATTNPLKQGRHARYSWMAIAERKEGYAPLQAIKKLDLVNLEQSIWSAAPRGFVSEPLMIPRPNSHVEDEGWILVLVWNGSRRGTDLVILNANNLKEEALIELPISIPHGLHGSWVNES